MQRARPCRQRPTTTAHGTELTAEAHQTSKPRTLQRPQNAPGACFRPELGHLCRIASRFRAETGHRDIYRLFNTASVHHENFYENQMVTQKIDEALQDVELQPEKLESIVSS